MIFPHRTLSLLVVSLLLAAHAGMHAEPLAFDSEDAAQIDAAERERLPDLWLHEPGDLEFDALAEATLKQQHESGRGALLRQPYTPRPPTWIQGAAAVNAGDFPSLDDPTVQAEQNLRTLEWLLQQQALDATGRDSGGAGDADTQQHWLRALLPGHWLPWLKEHRQWVAAGAGLVMAVVWLMAAFSRRSGSVPAPASHHAATTEPGRHRSGTLPPIRRRRRRHALARH